jgi:hypothetical protein
VPPPQQREQHWYCWEGLTATPQMKRVGSLPRHFQGRKPQYSARRSEHRDDRAFHEWRDRHIHRVIGQDNHKHAYVRYSSDGTDEGTLYEVWGWEPQWGAPPDAVNLISPPPPKKKGKGSK